MATLIEERPGYPVSSRDMRKSFYKEEREE
jgi:hypothetical protein